MPSRRGRPSRADDVAGYLAWRRAEERAAEGREGPAPAEAVLNASLIAEVSTVWDWRQTVPSIAAWRAWILERFGDQPGIPELVEAGALDAGRSNVFGRSTSAAIAAFHAEMIPRLDADLSQLRGRRPTARELAALTGASVSTVKRHRRRISPMARAARVGVYCPGNGNGCSERSRGDGPTDPP